MPPHPHLTCKRVATAPLSPSPSSTNAASIVRTDTQMVKYLTRYYFRATLSREISPPTRRCPALKPFLRPPLPLLPPFPPHNPLTSPPRLPRPGSKPFPPTF